MYMYYNMIILEFEIEITYNVLTNCVTWACSVEQNADVLPGIEERHAKKNI